MTDRLAEIRARLEAATPGPWKWEVVIAEQSVTEHTLKGPDVLCRYWYDRPPSGDGELIAHAPEDIAWLLGEVERLRALMGFTNALADLTPDEFEELTGGKA